jgi:NADPH:quinone reductase
MVETNKTFKAAVLSKYGEIPKIQEIPFRELQDNEILVKIMCTSFSPSDLGFINGSYGNPPQLPKIIGNEGSGIVEAVGKSGDQSLIGKRVSVIGNHTSNKPNTQGVWSQYVYTQPNLITVYDKKVEFETICCTFVNPLTAAGFIDTAKSTGKKAIAHTGASSPLGRMLLKLCIKEGIELINIVRKQSTIDEMTQLGGKHFINTSDKDWDVKLKELCEKLDVTLLFDCVGGEVTGKCLSAVKDGGIVYHYGNLELKNMSEISSGDLIFKKKQLLGWWLPIWLYTAKPESVVHYKSLVKEDLENNGDIFKTDYRKVYDSIDDFDKAIHDYVKEKSGRVLLKTN